MADLQLMGSYCSLPTRRVGQGALPGWVESRTAEWYMVECFTRFYQQRYPGSEVISELSYLDVDRFRGAMAILVKWMQAEFRNVLSRKALKGDIRSERSGRKLRADMLGVRSDGTAMILELVEVTTVEQAAETEAEDIQHKIQTLERYVTGEALKEMQYIQRASGVSLAPQTIEVRPATWRPYWNELYYPLVPTQMPAAAPGSIKFEWICYRPTFRPDGVGKDGLVLYEIHSTRLPDAVPMEVLRRVARRLRELENQHQLVLLPAMQRYWDDNGNDRKELQKWLAVGLGAALVVTLVFLAWPAAVPLAAEAAGAGLASAGEAEILTLANAARYATAAARIAEFFERAQAALRPLLIGGTPGALVLDH
ncbi:hypothetical protein [Dactylosporangium sp. CA-139066]|uniref:hypothetical protein n=1 Tax=Dactylosporangium sp. CA-139066 TaxID=3239930 RepID=UPI003D93D73E